MSEPANHPSSPLRQLRRLVALTALTALALVEPAVAGADPFGAPPPVDPIVLPAPAGLQAAIAAVEKATGAKGEAIEGRRGEIPLAEGRSFALDGTVAERLIVGSHAAFLEAGVYLFRYERGFGIPGEKDLVAVLAAPDFATVIRRMGTAGPRRGISVEQIVTWLTELHKEEPFELREIGVDYVAGKFARAPKDPAGLARRAAAFAPDLVAGHKDPIEGLTDLMGRAKILYLIWD